jgi:hypothetical protein
MFVSHTTKSNFMQFGHRVRTDLYVVCMDSGVTDTIFLFSENIGFGEIFMRIRFDDGPVYHVWGETRDQGNRWWLSKGYREPDNEEVDLEQQLLESSHVRVEFSQLPWAKTALLEFDTRGTAGAVSSLNCGSKK